MDIMERINLETDIKKYIEIEFKDLSNVFVSVIKLDNECVSVKVNWKYDNKWDSVTSEYNYNEYTKGEFIRGLLQYIKEYLND